MHGKVPQMLFIALIRFKKELSEEVVAENLKDIESDVRDRVEHIEVYWTLGRYDTVVIFEAPDEKTAMHVALRRLDRMDVEVLVALPADRKSPGGPA
jgi:uncharacterized protein with GYD domain